MPATTANMGLTQWTNINDRFNHSQLSANFGAIDIHDHTGGPSKGLQIPTAGLANLAITSGKLATNAVISAKILDANVTTPKLANLSVTAPKIGILPATRVYHNVTQTIANDTPTALIFNTERFDTDSMHDLFSNSSRITCKTAGVYSIGANIQWNVNATGTRQISLRVNGTTVIAAQRQLAYVTDDVQQHIHTIWNLAVNDYVEVVVRQKSTVALDVAVANSYSPEFYATFLSN